jgi:hypothetical protein
LFIKNETVLALLKETRQFLRGEIDFCHSETLKIAATAGLVYKNAFRNINFNDRLIRSILKALLFVPDPNPRK